MEICRPCFKNKFVQCQWHVADDDLFALSFALHSFYGNSMSIVGIMKPLTLGGGHVWVPMFPRGMNQR